MPIWTNSSPSSNLSRTLLPSLTELRANRQVRRNLLPWVKLMGLKPAAHDKLLIQALQETAEGKIDRFAAWLSQINLRLDIVLAVGFWARPRRPPRALAKHPGRQPHDRAHRPFGRGLLCGYLNPPVLRFTRRCGWRASAAMMPGGVAMYVWIDNYCRSKPLDVAACGRRSRE